MQNEDIWAMIGLAGLGISAYCYGKDSGVKQTTAKYEMQNVVEKQQQQIAELQQKLSVLEKYNRLTNNNNGVIL